MRAALVTATKQLIRVGHSPDPDDAFMFYALAKGRIDTGDYEFTHELVDIETLNRRAFQAQLELTAVSIHAYAFLHDKYVLCTCGASMGDGYGPMVVAREPVSREQLLGKTIAVPGKLTSAYLALRLFLGADFACTEVPFDEIIPAVVAGSYEGRPVEAGLIIHEGQLTFGDHDLKLVVDLGVWWKEKTGLPLPLGANAVRRNLGTETVREIQRLLKESIEFGLSHREDALRYALQYGRDLNESQADLFVKMYVNDWTLDFGPRGREAVTEFLAQGHAAGVLPKLVTPEFVK
jgi:1,4-dihydroxy-6-naphthoate synthase